MIFLRVWPKKFEGAVLAKVLNKSYTPWREGPDDRWIQYKNFIHMNVPNIL